MVSKLHEAGKLAPRSRQGEKNMLRDINDGENCTIKVGMSRYRLFRVACKIQVNKNKHGGVYGKDSCSVS